MKNIVLFLLFLAFTSCQNYYRTKKTERNEILRIFRGFKSVKRYKKEYRYSFTSKPFVYNKDDYNAHEFDSLLFEIEGLENASSKLYLNDFVSLIIYDKEKDEIAMWFENPEGAAFHDGEWFRIDNPHDIFPRF
ncbi:hypothetical protein Fleli_1935 [Bernardetia litoralis DSM 6794]|uniref:Uncharacterized protein n=1 Tax=Bernardetia litoralis (strain ATCC 23117 / DSM 6794 / NBRC 15988 / NCIMB 1366 / Fx l1 / Sio-4) TaxID=880071 RepID=I4AK38_BERLS|nr:hypothetical protein [Bernardetia litoralis]AFM04323.1 hypothetical protein Fleli_1935 [Bernardetia litoralis DSM 6794]